MNTKKSLGLAIRKIRLSRGLTQECFSNVSSRTYMSTLERGIYNPTVEKINEIAEVMNVHPLSILTLSYLISDVSNLDALIKLVVDEVKLATNKSQDL